MVQQNVSASITSGIYWHYDTMYIIPHGKTYNPDTFRNYKAPGTMEDKVAYGSCVLGTHSFPTEFLSARYVMTCTPIDDLDTGGNTIVKNLDRALARLKSEGKFRLIRTFELSSGYTFYVYERTVKTDSEEIAYLKDLFWLQSSRYPEDFEGVLDSYGKEKNIICK